MKAISIVNNATLVNSGKLLIRETGNSIDEIANCLDRKVLVLDKEQVL